MWESIGLPNRLLGLISLITASVGLLLIGVFSNLPVNLDCAIYLNGAKRMLLGEIPYVDFVDPNLPMAYYIHVIPVWLSSYTPLDLATSFHLIAVLLAFFSIGALYYLSSLLTKSSGSLTPIIVASGWAMFSLYVSVWGWFAERDYLFGLAYLPFLYVRMARHSGCAVNSLLALAVGLVAAPLILIKPHFCLVVVIVEAFMLVKSRKVSSLLSSEVIALCLVGVLYLSHFLFIPASMRDALFFRWIPFVTENYQFWNSPLGSIAFRGLPLFPFAAPIILAVFVVALLSHRLFRLPQISFQLQCLAVGGLAAYAMYLAQRKGFPYHFYPTLGFGTVTFANMLGASIDSSSPRAPKSTRSRFLRIAATVWFTAIILASATATIHRMNPAGQARGLGERLAEIIRKHTREHDRVMYLAWYLYPGTSALVYADRLSGTRYPSAWPIALFRDSRNCRIGPNTPDDRRRALYPFEKKILSEYAEDFERFRPTLLIVEEAAHEGVSPKCTFGDYLKGSKWLEKRLKDFRLICTVQGFSVYKRIEPLAAPPRP